MNNKLAQAVKLYDHILTQQVSHPTWRQQTTSPVGQHYGQWNHEPSPSAVQPPHTPAAQQWQQPASVYAPPQAYQAPTSSRPMPMSPHYQSVSIPQSPPVPQQSPQQAWAQPSYMSSDTSPRPMPVSPHYQSVPTPQSSVSQQYQYAQPIQPVSIQPPVPQAPAPTHAVGHPPQQEAPVPAQPPPVQQQVSSPPPVHQQPPSRQNTITHAVYVPPPTISPQQYARRPTAAPALPSFPSVPTGPPTIPYGSHESASSAVEQPKKEALLIEL